MIVVFSKLNLYEPLFVLFNIELFF